MIQKILKNKHNTIVLNLHNLEDSYIKLKGLNSHLVLILVDFFTLVILLKLFSIWSYFSLYFFNQLLSVNSV